MQFWRFSDGIVILFWYDIDTILIRFYSDFQKIILIFWYDPNATEAWFWYDSDVIQTRFWINSSAISMRLGFSSNPVSERSGLYSFFFNFSMNKIKTKFQENRVLNTRSSSRIGIVLSTRASLVLNLLSCHIPLKLAMLMTSSPWYLKHSIQLIPQHTIILS